jgi:flavin reductase (DIM6/NTAB) family NADH-FMN oxidoreductase RutF
MIASGEPLLYAVAINSHHFTARLIHETREFVVAAPTAGMGAAIHYCGTHSGHNGDKIEPAGLELVPAAQIQTPLIRGAAYNLECALHSAFETGDHTVFVGQVVAAHLDESAGPRLMNFGGDQWACAQVVPETVFRP